MNQYIIISEVTKRLWSLLFCVALLIAAQLLSHQVFATQIKPTIANFQNWTAHIEHNAEKKICYIFSGPLNFHIKDTAVDRTVERKPMLAINYLGTDRYTISVYAGHLLPKDSSISITIGNQTVGLDISQKEYAITYNDTQDMQLIRLLTSSSLKYFYVKSKNDSGPMAIGYYQLAGIVDALKYLKKHC